MPRTGEFNSELGVYRTACCLAEIVIIAGGTFPDCPNHPNRPAIWEAVQDEPLRPASEKIDNRKKSA